MGHHPAGRSHHVAVHLLLGMNERAAINRVPTNIRGYLLGWKNTNREAYGKLLGEKGLLDLDIYEVMRLYKKVCELDTLAIGAAMEKWEKEKQYSKKDGEPE